MSNFENVEERWLPSRSTFKFSDNYYANNYGEIMFVEFSQETKKSEDCVENCAHKYVLKARYVMIGDYYSDYSIVDEEVIVTSLNHFYQRIDISGKYEGIVLAGISFRDQKDFTV